MDKEKIIILGGSSGIGKATAKLINKKYKECDIIIVDKKNADFDFDYTFYKVDLKNEKEVYKFINYIVDIPVKSLINSVGYQENIDILDMKGKEFKEMFQITVFSVFLIEQAVAKEMIKNNIQNGTIINVSSIHSDIIREIANYSSAKAALDMLTKELAYKLSEYNIRVNLVLPGSIDTPLLRKDLYNNKLLYDATEKIPLKRHGRAEEVAKVIEFLISDNASYITGSKFVVDGGLSLII